MQDEPVIMVIGEGLPRMEENNSNTEKQTEQKMTLGNMEIDNEEDLPIMNALMCSEELDNTIEIEIMDDNKNVLKKVVKGELEQGNSSYNRKSSETTDMK